MVKFRSIIIIITFNLIFISVANASGQNVYEDILNIPLIIRYPENKQKGKRTAKLVSLIDIYLILVDLLGLNMTKLKYPLQGKSFKGTLIKGKPMKRDYFVSESWSKATVITKDYKLGIMLDPGDHQYKFDWSQYVSSSDGL